MNKWALRLGLVGAVILISYPVAYLVEANSGAFVRADRFVRASPYARQHFGAIQRITLRSLGKLSESDLSGNAELSLAVNGSADKGVANVTLVKANGIWSVSSAAIDGQIVQVAPDGQ